jgi:hypothetical protein
LKDHKDQLQKLSEEHLRIIVGLHQKFEEEKATLIYERTTMLKK